MATTGSSRSSAAKLLTPRQVTLCKKIAASGDEFSSRALALLTVHGGSTQVDAASQTGLTVGQVRYWVSRFRQIGMAAFPEQTDAPTKQGNQTKETAKPGKTKVKKKTKKKDKAKQKSKDDSAKNKKKAKKEKPKKKDKKAKKKAKKK